MSTSEFVQYILQHQAMHAMVVICSTREVFLEEIYASMPDIVQSEDGDECLAHPFLVATIHQLATSRTVNVAYAPTLAHLRAYLATYDSGGSVRPLLGAQNLHHCSPPMLAIFGMLRLHYSTVEFSAQGLSRTFAVAVEAATAASRRLVIADPPKVALTEDMVHATESDAVTPSDPWRDQIPLLNGSARFGNADRTWAERTIEAARVASRWCGFMSPPGEMDA